jgi:autotransporter-associated beta strand protein
MMGGGELTLAGNIPNNKEFRQLGGKIVLDSDPSGQQVLRHLILGDASGQSGVLELKKGKYKVKEDYIRIGAAGRFAMYQTGGELEGTAWVTNAIANGASSYGAYCLEGGVAKIFDPLNVANGAGSCGFFLQKGGSFKKTSQNNRNSAIRLGVKGEAVMHVSGGTNNSYYATSDNKTIGFIVGNEAGGTATLTVSGADTLVKTDIFQLGASDSARTNVLNLVDGGKLAASRFYAGAHSVDGVYQPYASEGYLNIVNANGGAFVPTLSDWWNNLGYICPAREPQKVVLFERGLAVDTSSCGGTHMFPLRLTSATGRGFDSISLPVDNAGFAAEKYIGPARVRISDATGWGATAYADFDRATGKLTGIVVTSRGCDYSENPVITVDSADGAKTYPCSFALSENIPGGLIKDGEGTMRLFSTNDYAGVTFVKTGVLQVEHDKAVPAASACRVGDGATLKFYNGLSAKKFAVKFKALGGAGVVSAESITLTGGINAAAADINSGKSLSVDCPVVFEEGAVAIVDNLSEVDPEVKSATLLVSAVPIEGEISVDRSVLPEPWTVKFSADRRKLRLVKRLGLSITVR